MREFSQSLTSHTATKRFYSQTEVDIQGLAGMCLTQKLMKEKLVAQIQI